MRLAITHETVYRYAQPVNYSIQHIRLTPLSDASQTILNWRLDCPGRTYRQTDTFGNILHVLVIDSAHDEIRVQVTGEAETMDNLGVLSGGAAPVFDRRPDGARERVQAVERVLFE